MRYLAIDYGTKRTGLAICDRAETIVSPLVVVEGQKGLPERIVKLVKDQDIEAIVVGLPLNMDDTQGPQAKLVFEFAKQLENHLQIPIHFQDERLSSFGAEGKLSGGQLTRAKKKKRLDAIAAAEILESFLEQKKTK